MLSPTSISPQIDKGTDHQHPLCHVLLGARSAPEGLHGWDSPCIARDIPAVSPSGGDRASSTTVGGPTLPDLHPGFGWLNRVLGAGPKTCNSMTQKLVIIVVSVLWRQGGLSAG
jgi:hypothetical protein